MLFLISTTTDNIPSSMHVLSMEAEHVFAVSDCCYEISKHLPLIDTLVGTNNKILSISSLNIRRIIEDRLIEIGWSRTKAVYFLDTVKRTGSIISGSFLLSVLVSVPSMPLSWKPEDIDIYSPQASDDYICPHCKCSPEITSRMSEFMCIFEMKDNYTGHPYTILKIKRSRKWESTCEYYSVTINEMIISKDLNVPLKQFIFDTFDFDFCKVTYDGETLSIYDPISILKKTCIYRGDKEALKYFDYKVKDKFSHANDERIGRIYKTYMRRKKKYESRGFTLRCEFDFGDEIINNMHTEERANSVCDEICTLLKAHKYNLFVPSKYETNIYVVMDDCPSLSNYDDTCNLSGDDYCVPMEQSLDTKLKEIIVSNYPECKYKISSYAQQIINVESTFKAFSSRKLAYKIIIANS